MQPLVAVPGWFRLVYEFTLHALTVWAFHDLGWDEAAVAFGAGTALHYGVSYQRVGWLLTQ